MSQLHARTRRIWDALTMLVVTGLSLALLIYVGFGEAKRTYERIHIERLAAQAKIVRASKHGTPITDGVFPETKEFLAGYWIVDVDSADRTYQIAARASAAPGPGGASLNMPIEVRQVMGGASEEVL